MIADEAMAVVRVRRDDSHLCFAAKAETKMKARNKQLEVFDDTHLGLSKTAYMALSPQ